MSLSGGEQLICTQCIYDLPYTGFHLQPDNIVQRQFWGKLQVEAAYAMCYFTKGGKIQHLVHRLKYKNMPDIGKKLGSMAADRLVQNNIFKSADVIVPVPLYKSRLRKRGYNQSAKFAEGIAEKLGARVETDNLVRVRFTETQTKKSRFERAENMRDVFCVLHPGRLAGKRVLLVDDIMTTGATLEACGIALLSVQGLQLCIATIAYTE